MTVYVDDAFIPARVGRINAKWSHLTADTQAELHAFAESIGLSRSWFQNKPGTRGRWHYDVTESLRAKAVMRGATVVAYRDMPEITRRPGREGVPEAGALMAEVATDCDECSSDIPCGVTCYAVPTGAEDEGRKVVRIVCAACYGEPDADVQHVTAVTE